LHLHFLQEEWFQVLQGDFIFEAGGEQHRMTPGTSILVPRMVPHRFQNTGSSTGKVLILAQPAGTLEEFFRRILETLCTGTGRGRQGQRIICRSRNARARPPAPWGLMPWRLDGLRRFSNETRGPPC
jgi:uncharacterized cupin superfamily protein